MILENKATTLTTDLFQSLKGMADRMSLICRIMTSLCVACAIAEFVTTPTSVQKTQLTVEAHPEIVEFNVKIHFNDSVIDETKERTP